MRVVSSHLVVTSPVERRLAIRLPKTTHVNLMEKGKTIIPMINDFLDAKSAS